MHIGIQSLTFNQSQAYCSNIGRSLYQVSNARKADAISNITTTYPGTGDYWINVHNPNLSDTEVVDLFGNPINSSFFLEVKPDNSRYCVFYKDAGKLDGKECSEVFWPICESICPLGNNNRNIVTKQIF